MENKFNWSALLIVLALVGFFVFAALPVFTSMDNMWMHFYIRMALALLATLVFGVLRLYNALVQNTRFLIRVKSSVEKLMQQFPRLEQVMGNLTNSNKALKTSTDALLKKQQHENNE